MTGWYGKKCEASKEVGCPNWLHILWYLLLSLDNIVRLKFEQVGFKFDGREDMGRQNTANLATNTDPR